MEPALLLPPAFWFRWKFTCPRVENAPRTGEERLCALPESARLPAVSTLGGEAAWWDLRAGWNPLGLALALEVRDDRAAIVGDDGYAELSDGIEVWIDTRDTRDIHRATRYCHRFLARVILSPRRGPLVLVVEQRKINRALEDARIDRQVDVQSAIGRLTGGWWIDLFFPASSLAGYDPETNPRLGFTYALHDPVRGDRFLTVGRDFPIGEDPSLWSTLELADAGSPAPVAPAKARKSKAGR